MGLLMFKERSSNDKSAFRRNEFHVDKKRVSLAANINQSQTIDGRVTRTSPTSSDASRNRNRRRHSSRPSGQGTRATPRGRLRSSLLNWLSRRSGDGSAERLNEDGHAQGDSDTELLPDDVSITSSEFLEIHDAMFAELSEGPHILVDDEEGDGRSGNHFRVQQSTSREFAPARQYYEDRQREQFFDVTSGRGHAHTSGSRSNSVGAYSRRRAASPDTQMAILREIRRQEDTENRSRLQLDGSADTASQIPRMTISRSDGLGDRRRSPSPNDDERRSNGSEDLWNDLTETIPAIDANLPSAGSSFASDSASSILSRTRAPSSFTNTPVSGTRAGSAEGGPVRQQNRHSHYCPEGNIDSADESDEGQPGFSSGPLQLAHFPPEEYQPRGGLSHPAHVPQDQHIPNDMLSESHHPAHLSSRNLRTSRRTETGNGDETAFDGFDAGNLARAPRAIDRALARHRVASRSTSGPRMQPPTPATRHRNSAQSQAALRPVVQARDHSRRTQHTSNLNHSHSHGQSNNSGHNNLAVDSNHHQISLTDLDSLDELLDMMNNGTEVPPEMWTAIGITPHLASLRHQAGRAGRNGRNIQRSTGVTNRDSRIVRRSRSAGSSIIPGIQQRQRE